MLPCMREVGNSFQLGIVALESKLVKVKYGDLALRFISFFTEEFAADIAVKGINVLRVPAGEGKVSSFECFPLIGRKYTANKIQKFSFHKIEGENFGDWPSIRQIRQCFLPPTFSAIRYV